VKICIIYTVDGLAKWVRFGSDQEGEGIARLRLAEIEGSSDIVPILRLKKDLRPMTRAPGEEIDALSTPTMELDVHHFLI
jgi:hypothetical protein